MDLWVGGRTLRLEVTGGKSRGSDGGRRLAAAAAEGNGPEEEEKAKEESPLCFVILRLKMCGGTLQILNISHEPMICSMNRFRNLCLLQVQRLPKQTQVHR